MRTMYRLTYTPRNGRGVESVRVFTEESACVVFFRLLYHGGSGRLERITVTDSDDVVATVRIAEL